MNIKTTLLVLMAAVFAATASAKKKETKPMPGNDAPVTTGKAAKINVDQMPRIGASCCMIAPQLQGASQIGQCYKKPRNWIVLETKYTTYGSDRSRFQDQLTFTWHVMLETKSAKENKGNKEGLEPYSYFTTSTTYYNIPAGTHASSVVLPPSYLERFGEPKAVGFVITNENGDELGGGTISEIKEIKNDTKFWDDPKIMDAKDSKGNAYVVRRQGLLDRAKTIWALVNPNDYETTLQ